MSIRMWLVYELSLFVLAIVFVFNYENTSYGINKMILMIGILGFVIFLNDTANHNDAFRL